MTVAKSSRYIRTGITELDKNLHGGLRRGELISIFGNPNSGKNLFCTSIAANAIRGGKKVLIINFQGLKNDAINRLTSNFCNIPFNNL